MSQEKVWDNEYRNPTFLTRDNKPQQDVVRFVNFLKKEKGIVPEGLSVLDLGSGTGRNSYYFAEHGAHVVGLEISETACGIARNNLVGTKFDVVYKKQSIGESFPCVSASVDIALDITSSNSLSEDERIVYLSETNRVLRDDGYFFVKALCKDGDENAKYLLKHNACLEKDTYIMPKIGIMERVWSKQDFVETYSPFFSIIHMEKKTNYSIMDGRPYKRNFWIIYMKK